mmetsp:Transcript_20823/g.46470  ORF Transcript_20823/g.46470 Transcript_20823/m.46470 type:complete len:232 (-) Transcript_20823:266-961(-)
MVGVGFLKGIVGCGHPDFLRRYTKLVPQALVGFKEHPEHGHHVFAHLLRRDVPVPVVVQKLPHRPHPRVRVRRSVGTEEAEARGELPKRDGAVVVRVKGVEEPVRQVVELGGVVLGQVVGRAQMGERRGEGLLAQLPAIVGMGREPLEDVPHALAGQPRQPPGLVQAQPPGHLEDEQLPPAVGGQRPAQPVARVPPVELGKGDGAVAVRVHHLDQPFGHLGCQHLWAGTDH